MHSKFLLDHFQNPRNEGELPSPALRIDVENPACGDALRLSIRIEGGKVADARYKAKGCTASVAVGSVLAEWLPGKTLQEVSSLNLAALEAMAGGLRFETRHAAVLCMDAVKELLRKTCAASQVPAMPVTGLPANGRNS